MRYTLLLTVILVACQPAANRQTPGIAMPEGVVIDLSHPFDADTVYWPTAAGFELTVDFAGMTDKGYYYSANSFCGAEHGGTHIDAAGSSCRPTESRTRAAPAAWRPAAGPA